MHDRHAHATTVYKICEAHEWRRAMAEGAYHGSDHDRRDGFVHFSTAVQLAATAAKHFRHRANLVLVAFEAAALGPALRWEPARDGALFPHLYAPLDPTLALWERPLALDGDGVPMLPEGLT
jgi:uncharacterized protein (DUF952 family)